MSKLTDRDAISAAAITKNLLIHVVDTTDTSQDAAGSSYKAALNSLRSVVRGYKLYACKLSQATDQDPNVEIVNINELGGTPVWTRSGVGKYLCTLADAFPTANRVDLFATGTESKARFYYTWTDASTITLFTVDDTTGSLSDDLMTDSTPIHILVHEEAE